MNTEPLDRTNALEAVRAARAGDVAFLERWLTGGGDPDTRDQYGWTPLLAAAAWGRSEVVEFLLFHNLPDVRQASPGVRFPGADGLPIYMAGHSGDLATVKAILRARPDHLFEVALMNGHTVLLQAAFYGQKPHQQVARYLVEDVASILSIPMGDEAALENARKRLLVATNVLGQNAVALARAYDIKPMVELLERFDVTTEEERSAYSRRLLKLIAAPPPRNARQREAQVRTDRLIGVIQVGLDRSRALRANDTAALQLVEDETLKAIEEILNEPGLDINRLGGPLQRTPLIIACGGPDAHEGTRSLRTAIVDRLLDRSADPLVNEVHAMGIDAVIRSAVWGHLYLLERFAPLMDREELAAALNVTPPVNGYTALHDSVLRALSASGSLLERYLAQIRWVIEHGARPDIEDFAGRTQEGIARAALSDRDFRENALKVLRAMGLREP